MVVGNIFVATSFNNFKLPVRSKFGSFETRGAIVFFSNSVFGKAMFLPSILPSAAMSPSFRYTENSIASVKKVDATGLSFFKKKAISTPEKLKSAKYVRAATKPSLSPMAREAIIETKTAKRQLVAMEITANGRGAKSVERLNINAMPLLNSKSMKDRNNQKININLFNFKRASFLFSVCFFIFNSIFIQKFPIL